ncbi:hypothetical protein R1flu_008199 [Riccia fluitans]|uniref:Uncharacterized protein n=1 Tax=Riccia fluitans TaxID=41844 RepID=A0ABD1YB01_9MARC
MLRDTEDREIIDERSILDYVHKYYADLYSQPTVSFAEIREQDAALNFVNHRVTEDDNHRLTEVPRAEELSNTVKSLPLEKSPGEDGLPVEVLRELWEEIGTGCLQFIQEAWKSKRIGKYNSGAVIKLIPKNTRKEDLKNEEQTRFI